jgi:hypothetical protein
MLMSLSAESSNKMQKEALKRLQATEREGVQFALHPLRSHVACHHINIQLTLAIIALILLIMIAIVIQFASHLGPTILASWMNLVSHQAEYAEFGNRIRQPDFAVSQTGQSHRQVVPWFTLL